MNRKKHNGVITHLEPDILEYKVKWALGSITMNKASGGDGIPVELYQILKDDAALNMPTNLENSTVATGLEKVSFHSNPKERQSQRMLKLLHNCTQTPHLRSGGCAGTGGPRGATPCSRSGGAVVRRYPSLKVRSSGCALLEQP